MFRRATFAFAGLLLVTAPAAAAPVLLDRLVAVIDAYPLYRSDVVARAKPYLARLDKKDQPDAKKMDALLREVLDKMIEEKLVEKECAVLSIAAEPYEVDRAIDEIAKQNKLDRTKIFAEAKAQGLSEEAYRAEVRRQILDLKWTQVTLRSRINPPITGTDEEKRAATQTLIEAERKKELARLRSESFIEVKW